MKIKLPSMAGLTNHSRLHFPMSVREKKDFSTLTNDPNHLAVLSKPTRPVRQHHTYMWHSTHERHPLKAKEKSNSFKRKNMEIRMKNSGTEMKANKLQYSTKYFQRHAKSRKNLALKSPKYTASYKINLYWLLFAPQCCIQQSLHQLITLGSGIF